MTIVTLDQVKEHLNITESDDDTLLSLKIQAAEGLVESYIGRKLASYFDDAAQAFTVPAPIVEAVRQVTAGLYENREGAPISKGSAELLAPFRLWSF